MIAGAALLVVAAGKKKKKKKAPTIEPPLAAPAPGEVAPTADELQAAYDQVMGPGMSASLKRQTADWLERWGRPDLAEAVRRSADSAAASEAAYGAATAIRATYDRAMQTITSIPELQGIGSMLDSAGFPDLAANIRAKIESLRSGAPPPATSPGIPQPAPPGPGDVVVIPPGGGEVPQPGEMPGIIPAEPPFMPPMEPPAVAPVPPVVPAPPVAPAPPVVVAPVPVEPEPDEPEAPTPVAEIPADTLALVRKMLAEEGTNRWKYTDGQVKAWQRARGMVDDGKFGPGSALRMAQEIGTLPLVRYWPSGSLKNREVPKYQASLYELANEAEDPRAAQLRAAAEREKGQGFGTARQPVDQLIVLEDTIQ